MDVLSEQLVSFEYRDRLNDDLQRADLCRFLVAYISEDGLHTLNRPTLVQALRNEQSFGVSSLTCACGYKPLLKLQRDVGEHKPACLAATSANEPTFEQWFDFDCRNAPTSPLESVTIILAVQKNGAVVTAADWSNLASQGIYLQALEESEGKRVRSANDRLLVMVWDSRAQLEAGIPPVLLRCRESAHNAGPTSEVRGTNRSLAPMAGFGAVLYDEAQLLAMQHRPSGSRSSQLIWSGHQVELYDFEFRQPPTDSAQIDGGVRPQYQFHLEVDHIIFPADCDPPTDPPSGRTFYPFSHPRRSPMDRRLKPPMNR